MCVYVCVRMDQELVRSMNHGEYTSYGVIWGILVVERKGTLKDVEHIAV